MTSADRQVSGGRMMVSVEISDPFQFQEIRALRVVAWQ